MHLGVSLRDGNVVDEGERFCANADEVVDVHRYAVDAHSLQPSRLGGQLQLRAHPVSRQSESRITELDDASEPAGQGDWSALLARCPNRRAERIYQTGYRTSLSVDVDSAGSVVHRIPSHSPAGRQHSIILTIGESLAVQRKPQ